LKGGGHKEEKRGLKKPVKEFTGEGGSGGMARRPVPETVGGKLGVNATSNGLT